MRMLTSLLALASCLPLGAQQMAAIQGVVLNAVTGEPLANVHAAFMVRSPDAGMSSAYGAIADEAGRFSITAMAPGTYFVLPQRAGFLLVSEKDGPAIPTVTLKPGEIRMDFRIHMAPRAVISGRVLDENGDPVRHAAVHAEPPPEHAVLLALLRAGFGATDDRGYYRMSAPPGKYRVKANLEQHESDEPEESRTDGSVPAVYPPTWYPQAPSAESAAVVELQPGRETSGIDIHLGAPVRLTIGGVVTGIPSGSKAFVNVNALSHHGSTVNDIPVTADGGFSLGRLQPGTYYLFAWTTEQNHLQSAVAELNLTGTAVSGLMLALKQPSTLTGSLEMETGAGDILGHTVRLEPLTGASNFGQAFMGDVHYGAVNRDGSFAIGSVTPERYRVTVRPLPEDGYVKSVRFDGTPVANAVVDLRNGANGSSLKILVSNRGARISGAVEGKSGRIADGLGFVLLLSPGSEERSELWRAAAIEPDGAYRFRGIAPGRYRLFVMGHPGEASLSDLIARAQTIEVKEGDRIAKDLTVDDAQK